MKPNDFRGAAGWTLTGTDVTPRYFKRVYHFKGVLYYNEICKKHYIFALKIKFYIQLHISAVHILCLFSAQKKEKRKKLT